MLCSLLSYRHLVQHPAIFSFTSIYRRSHCPLRSHPSTCSFLSSVVRLLRARAFAMQPLTSQQPLLSQLNSQQQSQQQQQSQLHTPSTHNQLGLNNTPSTSPTPPTSTTTPASNAASPSPFPSRLYQHVLDLTSLDKREAALLELSKKREEFPDLAPILWHSFGTISALLQEIVSIYPLLSPPRLTPSISNRCCNALALLQCVASHTETRGAFLNSHLGLFLYPFLNTVCTYRQYEYLRLTSLGVIGALVKMDDSEVISFLLQTEIIPLCLRIMDNGSELSKTVATFIIQKILLDEMGLNYICATYERFSTVASVLSKMITGCIDRPSVRLLKHIVRDATFVDVLKDDPVTKRWLAQLLYNIGETTQPQQSQQQQQSALAGAGGQQGSAGGASGQSLLQGGQMGGGGNGGTSAS